MRAQIINILIGLGLPWTLASLSGRPVLIRAHKEIKLMATIQACNVAFNVALILLPTWRTWKRGDHSKASLGKRKAVALLAAYATALVVYAAHLFSVGDREEY